MTRRPRIFTFYSYKGGVGRSMALLNVAYELHARGRHILIVDLDLEAPGVSGFLSRNDELVPAAVESPDVVDLLREVLPSTQWELGSASAPPLPPLSHYIREVRPEKYAPPVNPRFRRTRFDVVCANDGIHYTDRLAQLKISECNAETLANLGDALRAVFFSHSFPWAWRSEDPEKPTGYDYILIDSRTGLTETGGLCVGPLSDRLVVFCGLNDQNISGTREFLNLVGIKLVKPETGWDDADDKDRSKAIGEKPTLIVATPVPYGEMEMKRKRLSEMDAALGVAPAQAISYHPQLALWETVFCRDYRTEAITGEYRNLASLLMRLVADHPGQIQASLVPFGTDAGEQPPDLHSIFALAAADPDAAESVIWTLIQRAEITFSRSSQAKGAEAEKLFLQAEEFYGAVVALAPEPHFALYHWGAALLGQGRRTTGDEAERLFRLAGEKYAAILAINPNSDQALYAWGNALLEQAKRTTEDEAESLFSAAKEKYEAALLLNPSHGSCVYNLACLYALRRDVPSSIEWLQKARGAGEVPNAGKLEEDPDFDAIRNEPAFQAFLASLQKPNTVMVPTPRPSV